MAECSNGPGKGLRCWKPGMGKNAARSTKPSLMVRLKERAQIAKSNREMEREARKGSVEEPFERDFPGDVANDMGIKKKQEKASRWLSAGGGGYKFVKGGIKKK